MENSSDSGSQAKVGSLVAQAQIAWKAGDRRNSGLLIQKILKLDFTNAEAWQLLHEQYGNGKSLADFQKTFAEKYYPTKAHLLVSFQERTQPVPFVAAPTIPELRYTEEETTKIQPERKLAEAVPSFIRTAYGSTPPVQADPLVVIRFCPNCGEKRGGNRSSCAYCQYQFSQADFLNPSSPADDPFPQPMKPAVYRETQAVQPQISRPAYQTPSQPKKAEKPKMTCGLLLAYAFASAVGMGLALFVLSKILNN